MHHGRGQRGETLVEILVTVSIMTVAFVGVLGGIATTFITSDTGRQAATAEGVMRNYAERITDSTDVPYVDCAVISTYPTPTGFVLPAAGWTATVTTVAWWQGDSAPATFNTTTCAPLGKSLQQITLTVKSPTGQHQVTTTLLVVKRKP